MNSLLLRRVRVMDESGDFPRAVDVLAEDDVITKLGPDLPAPRGAAEFDGADRFLMPGVIDCHAHVGMSSADSWENLNTPYSLRVLQTARNLHTMLSSGVTFVRDAGGVDAGVRDALRQGLIEGPEMQVAVALLCQTGGHMDTFLPSEGVAVSTEGFMPAYPGRPDFVVDGPDEMRRAVRQVIRAGADWIKLCATGGIFGGVSGALAPQLSPGEINTAVYEARKAGRPVMVHAVGGEGATWAIEAHCRSLEHGVYLTEEQIALMQEHGTFFVPTLTVYHHLAALAAAPDSPLPPALVQSGKKLGAQLGESVRMAREAGVPIALGIDSAEAATHGHSLEEIYWLCRAGLPIGEALLAATRTGAQLCGVDGTRGVLKPGYRLDALLLRGDPSDPAVFREGNPADAVFLAGKCVK